MPKQPIEKTLTLNHIVDSIRESTNSKIDEKSRGKLGQFMSSSAVSQLMASMYENIDGNHRLLDAGSGVGSLTAAFVEIATLNDSKSINSTNYELSDLMVNNLNETLNHCAKHCADFKVSWNQKIINSDFIEGAVNQLIRDNFEPSYNKVILNPPYLKIASKGSERALLRKVGIETGNLYSAFVALAIKLLEKNGELVAITPRSFCNGPYFNNFRHMMLNECSLNKIHVFNSRKSAFKVDKVLQENIIYHITKGEPQREMVTITSSSCAEDPNPIVFEVPFSEVVKTSNSDRFIHIITTEEERKIADIAGSLPCSLNDLGIQASTGRVVDFRTRENLQSDFIDGSVPLIFPQHIKNSKIQWPIPGAKKPNAILNNENTAKLMVPNGTYVLTRRLSSKEEKRRIVASIYTADIANVEVVAFENKTNYFHANGKPLNYDLAKGLCTFLNSTLVDRYFRQMNGHTQVNATDLRTLRYPSRIQLEKIARLIDSKKFDQEVVDEIVNRIVTSPQHQHA